MSNVCPKDLAELEKTVGHVFAERTYIQTAMTHTSYANEMREKIPGIRHNERLEFLGDSVLSLVTSEYLFSSFRDLPEGELTKIRAAVVSERSLCVFARKIGLGEYLRMGHGEELTGGRDRDSTLADAFEALLAALFLDGGMAAVKPFLLPFLTDGIHEAIQSGTHRDYKTALQEIVQKNREESLEYVLAGEEGPAHNKSFRVEVHINSNVISTGIGHSKKEAEQRAAHEALRLFGEDN